MAIMVYQIFTAFCHAKYDTLIFLAIELLHSIINWAINLRQQNSRRSIKPGIG